MINIYGIHAGQIEHVEYIDYEANVGFSWYEDAICIVAAPTRGKARSLACTKFNLEYTDKISIKLLDRWPNCEAGIIDTEMRGLSSFDGDMCHLWWLYAKAFYPDETPDFDTYKQMASGEYFEENTYESAEN